MTIQFDTSYARLPERFYVRVEPASPEAPGFIRLNRSLARDLGLDPAWLEGPEGLNLLSGATLPHEGPPLAMAYAGHQFGQFVPQLGDGRALLLGEVIDAQGRRRDIQLKGAGRTPFSRGGDGKAALGPVLREYILSEAMAALNIPTTRALAAVSTGDKVLRDAILPGAIVVRVAASHIRVGTFQYFAARDDQDALASLVDYTLERHGIDKPEGLCPAEGLIAHAVEAQARLIADWMSIGFIHGVMNTDNTTLSGETIDYGPCAFLDGYDPDKVYSSIDQFGRYAYSNQPRIGQWNLARLAEALLGQLDQNEDAAIAKAQKQLERFVPCFEQHWLNHMRRKIGLSTAEEGDSALIARLHDLIARDQSDFTLSFRSLSALARNPQDTAALEGVMQVDEKIHEWIGDWHQRLARERGGPKPAADLMDQTNPLFIPRNHRVEEAIAAAVGAGDFAPFHRLVDCLAQPFKAQPDNAYLALPPKPEEEVRQTFCGT